MRKAFDIEDINIDDLIATAMDDPEAVSGGLPQFRGMNLGDLHIAYKQFCKNETVENSPVNITNVIEYYNRAVANLPDHARLRGMRLPGASVLLDGRGQKFAEVFEQDQRRVWVPLAEIPAHVRAAFIAAEDKRFQQHRGIDERALIRAFIGNLTQSGRPQGGSTITQQLVKNLLVGDDLSYERKMREMIVAARVERLLSKDEILELYLNSVFLGRGSWGIELAARAYFGKPAGELTLAEGALLAALTKGPNFFNPDRHPQRVRDRFVYVMQRMREDDVVERRRGEAADHRRRAGAGRLRAAAARHRVPLHRPGLARGAHHRGRRRAHRPDLYRPLDHHPAGAARRRGGLAGGARALRSRRPAGCRARRRRPISAEAIRRIEAQGQASPDKPAWQQALTNARLPLYDVHWPQAIVLEEKGGNVRVGLADGRIVPLTGPRNAMREPQAARCDLCPPDRDQGRQGQGRTSRAAELRVRPTVQGAAVVLENQTGRILAMAGGFSYPLSQLNRVTQSQRQPGSAIKPVSYLAALAKGLQPNTLVRDEPVTLAADRRRQCPHPLRGLLDAAEL